MQMGKTDDRILCNGGGKLLLTKYITPYLIRYKY